MSQAERKYYSGRKLSPEELREEFLKEPPGAVLLHNALPPGLFIIENFLAPDVCDKIVSECAALEGQAGKVLSSTGAGGVVSREVQSRTVDDLATDGLSIDIGRLAHVAFSQFIGPHYGRSIEWFERPKILRYRDKGEYYAHADAYNWNADQELWERVVNRDYSLLIYLNENFSGGELEFKYLNHRIAPRKGLLVSFPSDWRYAHAAAPVAGGVKHSIVTFAAATDSPRVAKPPPSNVIRL